MYRVSINSKSLIFEWLLKEEELYLYLRLIDRLFQTLPTTNEARSVFLEKARLAGEACTKGEFDRAVQFYTEAINVDPNNHVLYGNRSATLIRTRHFERALEDGKVAAQLQPDWSKVGDFRVFMINNLST